MTWIDRALDSFGLQRKGVQKRDLQISEALLKSLRSGVRTAGVNVTPESSLQASAVWACVRVISESVASLPLFLYERLLNGGKQKATEHPLYRLLHERPNPLMTSLEYREVKQSHLCTWGNAYSFMEYDRDGQVTQLWPLQPRNMQVFILPNNDLLYEYTLPSGEKRLWASDQVLHLKGLGSDGVSGHSPIRLAAGAIGLSIATEQFGGMFFENGARPGGILRHPGVLSEEAYTRLKENWDSSHQGLDNASKIGLLEEGMDYVATGIPNDEAQFLETRKFQVNEIARIFRVPPHLIGDLDRATFSNIEQQSIEFVVHTLRPWLVRWEQGLNQKVLLEKDRGRFFFEHSVEGLLRGDTVSRYQSYAIAVTNGWMNRNEVRGLENLNPSDGLDEFLIPMNMGPAGMEEEPIPPTRTVSVTLTNHLPVPSTTGRATEPVAPTQTLTPALSLEGRGENSAEMEERARKVQGRYKLMRTYRKVLRATAARILKREVQDMRAAVNKYLPERGVGQFDLWLEGYLKEHRDFITKQMAPVMASYVELVGESVSTELKKAVDENNVEAFVDAYLKEYAWRHTIKSEEKLKKALERAVKEGRDPAIVLMAELDLWEEDRVETIADAESVRLNNAAAKMFYALAGVMVLRWYAMGDNSCPYCQEMNGKIVGIEKTFVKQGDKMDGGEQGTMEFSHNVGHPPLHDGCSCLIGAG